MQDQDPDALIDELEAEPPSSFADPISGFRCRACSIHRRRRRSEAIAEKRIHRGMRDIRKLMPLAGADHPEAAAEEERTATRERMRAHRAAHVRRPVECLFELFLQLDADQRVEVSVPLVNHDSIDIDADRF